MLSSFRVPVRFRMMHASSLGMLLATGCTNNFVPTATTTPPVPPAPYLVAISPGMISVSATNPVTITLIGGNFDSSTQVLEVEDGIASSAGILPSTLISSTAIQLTLPSYFFNAGPSIWPITVFEAPAAVTTHGGVISLFVVSDKPKTDATLVPAISNSSPASLVAGRNNSGFILQGANFKSTSTIEINGTARETVWPASNTLIATDGILASDVATAGSLQIVVISDPNVAPSAPLTVPVVPQ